MSKLQTLGIRIPPEDYLKLQAIANNTGCTLSDVAREAIERYLGKRGAGAKTRSRLDRLEDQVRRLTLLVVQPGGNRTSQAVDYARTFEKL